MGVGIHDSYFLPNDAKYPFPIGIEAAGVIEEIGSEVRGHRPEERIAFVSSMQPKGGTWAEYVAVKATSLIMPIPTGLGFVEAAAIPVAGNTALKALGTLATAPVDGSLFIAGGSGAIGTVAIQLARQRGWHVAASASKPNHDYMLSLGAHKVVDYGNPPLARADPGVDAQWRRRCLGGATGHLGGKFARREGRWNIGVDLRRCTHLRMWHTHDGGPLPNGRSR